MHLTESNIPLQQRSAALKDKKLFIFDMDGTIYLGDQVFPPAVEFIKRLRREGRHVLFFTNNASHTPAFYKQRLQRMGFEPQDEEIMTSGDVTAAFLRRHRAGQAVYLVGTEELQHSFEAVGIPLSEQADIVVSSFDTSLTYEKLRIACHRIRGGAEYLCTHPDFNCPTEDGFIPDSGAIAALITASTGVKPRYFGKPYADTMDMLCETTGYSKNDMCVFGDRLYTDIALGKQNGVCAVLVLTGETTRADIDGLPEENKPDIIYESLAETMADIFD